MRLCLQETVFSQTFVTLTGGPFLIGYALSLGYGPAGIGWLVALPFLAQAAQFLGAWMMGRLQRRKALVMVFVGTGRALWLLLIPIAFLGEGASTKVLVPVVVVVSSAIALAGTVPWLSWLGDLVPARARGRWIARRQQIIGAVTIVASLGGGVLVDWLTRERGAPVAFLVLFGMGGLAALISLGLLARQPEREHGLPESPPDPGLLGPLRQTGFRRVVVALLLWNVAVGISAPFFTLYMFRDLRMSYTQVAVYVGIVSVVAFLANPLWGRLLDRFGVRPVLLLNAFAIPLVPLFWLFPAPGWLLPVWTEAVYSGLVWTGFNLAAFTLPLAVSSRGNRPYRLAYLSAATGLGFGIASALGGNLGRYLEAISWDAPWGTEIIGLHAVFCLSAVLRFAAAWMFRGFEETGARGTGTMIQVIGYGVLRRFPLGRQLFLRRRDRAG